ncbi:MAG TPA: S8 family serine peptidase [Planctomycetota bacterium]|nr:S8 family serine peptidase [Planctomycetota bacterium]
MEPRALLPFVALVVAAVTAAAQEAPPAARFLELASKRLATPPGGLALDRVEGPVVLRDAGVSAWVASVLRGGEKTVVSLDAEGREVDLAAARALDAQIAQARRGKIDRRLAEELAKAAPGARLDVLVRVETPPVDDLRTALADRIADLDVLGLATRDAIDDLRAAHRAEVAAVVAPRTRAVADRLRAAGIEVVSVLEGAPWLRARADAGEAARIAADPGVAEIGTAEVAPDRVQATAVKAIKADLVQAGAWDHAADDGAGARISVNEWTNVCSSPYLPVTAAEVPSASMNPHTSMVASLALGRNPAMKGAAPGASLLVGADGYSENACVWSVNQSADVINLSITMNKFGEPSITPFDKFCDWLARTYGVTVCAASGNSAEQTYTYAGHPGGPGNGYNALTVGATWDHDTPTTSDDTMAGFSNWKNPDTAVETPQVVAPGVSITSVTGCGSIWDGTWDGTSCASPLAAGSAALLVSKVPALGIWQEAVRALLMASAWHNIEGGAAMSSKDGAGSIDALGAYRALTDGRYSYGTLTPASFDGSGFYTALTVDLVAGETARVALAFDSQTSGAVGNPPTVGFDQLAADLDLYVYLPGGVQWAVSASAVNSFEVVQFTALLTGTYVVKIKNYAFPAASEYFGIALSTDSDPCTLATLPFGSGSPSAMKIGSAGCASVNGAGFKLTSQGSPGALLGIGFVSTGSGNGSNPIGFPFPLWVNLAAPGGVWLLDFPADPDGSGLAPMPIPNLPSLAGYHIYAQALWVQQFFSPTLGLITNWYATPGLVIPISAY